MVTRAEYLTTCPACDEDIEPGDAIENEGAEWIHADCSRAMVW